MFWSTIPEWCWSSRLKPTRIFRTGSHHRSHREALSHSAAPAPPSRGQAVENCSRPDINRRCFCNRCASADPSAESLLYRLEAQRLLVLEEVAAGEAKRMQSVRSRPPELRGCDAQPSLLNDFLPLFSFDRGEPSPLLPSPSRRSNARFPYAARGLSRSRPSARRTQSIRRTDQSFD